MEGKIFAMLAIFALVVGSVFGLNYLLEVDQKGNELSDANTALQRMKQSIEHEKAALQELHAKVQTAQTKVENARQRDTLRSEIKDLEASRAKLLDQFSAAVAQIRSKSSGLAIDDIPMPNGQVLQQVVIQKVTPTDLTVTHSQGVTRIAAGDFPAALKARFRVGMIPTVAPQSP